MKLCHLRRISILSTFWFFFLGILGFLSKLFHQEIQEVRSNNSQEPICRLPYLHLLLRNTETIEIGDRDGDIKKLAKNLKYLTLSF